MYDGLGNRYCHDELRELCPDRCGTIKISCSIWRPGVLFSDGFLFRAFVRLGWMACRLGLIESNRVGLVV